MTTSPAKTRVFLFDHDVKYRFVLGMYLKTRGYEVIEASSAGACPVPEGEICTRDENDPCAHIIISRIGETGREGFAFLEGQIAKGCKAKQMALILDHPSLEEENSAKELGIHTFLRPMGLSEVKLWIERALPNPGSYASSHAE